eukprot:TRINITY_DN1392_c0_g1_i2.p1 TRINITY_DN1392_c0_g1~~TRINITY_DN1392_c0_g1_i2.p1  ORF type:complete len:166 (-),score=58.12 TRINITY_DN1392_c0_g1_i2:368-865(-)
MGNEPSAKQTRPPPPDIYDMMFQMKMTSKQFERESKKAEADKKKEMAKAREALKKGNEEGARLFLANAGRKQQEASNLLKMSHKMEAIASQIKGSQNQVALMESLNKLTPFLNQQANTISIEKVYTNMNDFQKAMDDLTISAQLIDATMNKNLADENTSTAVFYF